MPPAQRKTPFVTVALTEPAREVLRRATVRWTPTAGRQISMSDAVLAAFAVAEAHDDELAARLTAEDPPPS